MTELSAKAAGARAQISNQNIQESLIANVRTDEEALRADITKLLPLDTSIINAYCCNHY